MKTNDIKSGSQIVYKGQQGVMRDNQRGLTRLIEVPKVGGGTDTGSAYVFDITHAIGPSGEMEPVELTEKQIIARIKIRRMGF